jgi:hypothetical protein
MGSLLKEELLGEFSGFFYGLHPAPKNKITRVYYSAAFLLH